MNRQCSKTAWPTEQRARQAGRWMKGKGERVHPYLCPHCHRWHLGHSTPTS